MVSFQLMIHLVREVGYSMVVGILCLQVDIVLRVARSMAVGVDLRMAEGVDLRMAEGVDLRMAVEVDSGFVVRVDWTVAQGL